MSFELFISLLIAFVSFVFIIKGFKRVQQSECMIIERFGKYQKTLNSGLNLIVPFVDEIRQMYWVDNGQVFLENRIDLREAVLDVPEQSVITKDNVSINIDALMYIQITDPFKATYEIANLPMAVAQLAQTSLRNVIGEMDLDETLASRDTINSKLKTILDDATDKWGTKVNRVELRNITPPKDIQNAMEKQMQAERERRAKVLQAEGDKQARIQRSEGVRQEQINLAEGEKEAALRKAEGEAGAIRELAEANKTALTEINTVLGNPSLSAQYLVTSKYVSEFGKFTAKEGDKVFIPYESSTALGSLGTIKELLNK